ncbi:MAG: hypothetical protein QMD71_01090 [bacterium]|nr:hypothetical protein [bacterium]
MKFREALKGGGKFEFPQPLTPQREVTVSSVYEKAVAYLKDLFSKVDKKGVRFESPKEIVKLLVDTVGSDESGVIDMAYTMPTLENYVPMHSVNVCILCLATGYNLKLLFNDLIELGTASLLHCIGRHMPPSEILKIKNKEYLIAKEKWLDDTKLLEKVDGISETVKSIIYQHHERLDDIGCPSLDIKGEIHPLTKILIIVDFYITMIQHPDPEVSKKCSSYNALTAIIEKNGAPFDASVIKAFIEEVGIYPRGTYVELSTKEIGVVTKETIGKPMSPIVEVMFGTDGKKLKEAKLIDLSVSSPVVSIKRMISENELPKESP